MINRKKLYKKGKLWVTASIYTMLGTVLLTSLPLNVVTAQAIPTSHSSIRATSNKIVVQNANKTYDNDLMSPIEYTVTVPDGTIPPKNWKYTKTENTYLVPEDSGDLDLNMVGQMIGSYPFTLSQQGIDKLNKDNPNSNFKLSDVTGGTLNITPETLTDGSVVIGSKHKKYDNDKSTDPKEYTITFANNGLKAPEGWTKSGDNEYTVKLSSGDIQVNNDEKVGTYNVTFTSQGLNKLKQANTIYTFTDNSIINGTLRIENNDLIHIGTNKVEKDKAAPTSVMVTLTDDSYKVPSDWKVSYKNGGVKEISYDVPWKYFDDSNVDLSKSGTYTLPFTKDTINTFAQLNGEQSDMARIKSGQIKVLDTLKAEEGLGPSNFFANIDGLAGGPDNTNYFSINSVLTINLRLVAFNKVPTPEHPFHNLTWFFIAPAGFQVANVDSDGHGSVPSDPAQALKKQLDDSLAQTKTRYNKLTVTRKNDYKGRQVFCIQMDTATAGDSGDLAKVHVMTDPSQNVSEGYIGPATDSQDSAVLYVTDDPAYVGNSYTAGDEGIAGSYPNVAPIANALGITKANVLSSSYTGFWYHYKMAPLQVKDTYKFVDYFKNALGETSTTGLTGTSYLTKDIVKQFLESGGSRYEVLEDEVPTTQLYSHGTSFVSNTDKVVQGYTYTQKYAKVINTDNRGNDIQVQNVNITEKDNLPDTFKVKVPKNLNIPSDWVLNSDGTYSVPKSYFDLSQMDTKPGMYHITLTNAALSEIAGLNHGILFDKYLCSAGYLDVKAVYKQVLVHYVDDQTDEVIATDKIQKEMGKIFDYTDSFNSKWKMLQRMNYLSIVSSTLPKDNKINVQDDDTKLEYTVRVSKIPANRLVLFHAPSFGFGKEQVNTLINKDEVDNTPIDPTGDTWQNNQVVIQDTTNHGFELTAKLGDFINEDGKKLNAQLALHHSSDLIRDPDRSFSTTTGSERTNANDNILSENGDTKNIIETNKNGFLTQEWDATLKTQGGEYAGKYVAPLTYTLNDTPKFDD